MPTMCVMPTEKKACGDILSLTPLFLWNHIRISLLPRLILRVTRTCHVLPQSQSIDIILTSAAVAAEAEAGDHRFPRIVTTRVGSKQQESIPDSYCFFLIGDPHHATRHDTTHSIVHTTTSNTRKQQHSQHVVPPLGRR